MVPREAAAAPVTSALFSEGCPGLQLERSSFTVLGRTGNGVAVSCPKMCSQDKPQHTSASRCSGLAMPWSPLRGEHPAGGDAEREGAAMPRVQTMPCPCALCRVGTATDPMSLLPPHMAVL